MDEPTHPPFYHTGRETPAGRRCATTGTGRKYRSDRQEGMAATAAPTPLKYAGSIVQNVRQEASMERPIRENPPTHPIFSGSSGGAAPTAAAAPRSAAAAAAGSTAWRDVHELRQRQQRFMAQRLPTVQHLPSRNERAHPPALYGGTFDLRPAIAARASAREGNIHY